MRAILFDLDGTLLDLDLSSFLERYFRALDDAARPLFPDGTGHSRFMAALHAAVGRMMEQHPGVTNQRVFFNDLRDATGFDLEAHWHVFEGFYRDVFPSLAGDARPAKGARRVLELAHGLGLKTAIATNPIFPRIAVDHRIAWAGLADMPIDAVTTYETMEACKPHPGYFRQTAHLLRVDTTECMMVGDDRMLDIPASDVGMTTFYVGRHEGVAADFSGDLDDLADLLPRLL